MRAKMASKRAAKSVEDSKLDRENEKIRRRAGQDSTEMREELERKQRIKEAERKRKERLDDVRLY